jgi:uncharacterized protein (TIGR01777 family)
MHVLIAGASGLIGSALVPHLAANGHRVTRLVRSPARADGDVRVWNPEKGVLETETLANADAIVHLGGANVGTLWTPRKKRELRSSRVRSTRLIADRISDLARSSRPPVFVHASAVGYYGDRGDEVLTESSPPGHGFLPDLCRDWETASNPARDAGSRVVHVRTGLVLSRHGGVLRAMLPAFRLGLGARLGDGSQWMPWIALEDLVQVYAHAVTGGPLEGPVNAVSPEPVRNAEFSRAVGALLHKPVRLAAPAFALRLLPGRMADEALLASERVLPEALRRAGFVYQYPTLPAALAAALR